MIKGISSNECNAIMGHREVDILKDTKELYMIRRKTSNPWNVTICYHKRKLLNGTNELYMIMKKLQMHGMSLCGITNWKY